MSAASARDLRPVARAVMADEGFAPEPPPDAAAAASALQPLDLEATIAGGARDMRALLWSSIEADLADELWVDVATVRDRLAFLDEYETEYLEKAIRAREA